MSKMMTSSVILLLALTCWKVSFSSRIEIIPFAFEGLVTSAVNITCTPGKLQNNIKEIVGIQILKGVQQLASLRQSSEVVYGTDLTTIFQAEGLVDSDVDKCFLRISMPHVLIRDSGKYTCNVHYVDEVGFLGVNSTWENLVVDDLDIQNHVAFLIKKVFIQEDLIKHQARQLENQTKQLESQSKQLENQLHQLDDQASELEKQAIQLVKQTSQTENTDIKLGLLEHAFKTEGLETVERLATLENTSRNEIKQIEDMMKNDTPLTIFSASQNSTLSKIKNGDVLAFGNILTQVGKGYDKSTGMFTAPYKGLYTFQLTLTISNSAKRFRVQVEAAGTVVATLYVGDENNPDQSSVNCLVVLEAGDVVKLKVEWDSSGTADIYNHPRINVFSGYLIKMM